MDRGRRIGTQTIVSLRDGAALATTLVGAKAANLASLFQAGFPVPDGLVLTTHAGRPSEFGEELGRILDHFGDTPMAVRSSATAEDLPDSSYAGQYESFLGSAAGSIWSERCWPVGPPCCQSGYRPMQVVSRRRRWRC